MVRKILIGLGVLLLVIQFIHPDKNDSNDLTYDINTKYLIPASVKDVFKVACSDCHTNNTVYPWYSKIQPVAWWLSYHVNDGKKHLNLSSFTNQPLRFQNHKFEEIIEMVEEHEMPLPSYTNFGLHPEAQLTDDQRKAIINWAKEQMDILSAKYPADSLKMKRRR